MLPDIDILSALVRQVAQQEIMPRFAHTGFEFKQDGSPVTEADLAANQRLCDELQQRWPHIDFLSEEMAVQEQEALLQSSEWLWCLDPLDGTSNFAAGVPLFATSLALLHQGEVVLGVTYDPVRDELFSARKGHGAFLNGKNLQGHANGFSLDQCVALADFKRLDPALSLALVADPPYGSQRNLGTCALEWAWMAASRGQVYLHGSMKIWDLAVGSLLLAEAGGQSCTIEGEAVFRHTMQMRSVVASPDKALFEQWYAYIHALRA